VSRPGPVWVVGAGGLLGRHVAQACRTAGHDVLTTDVPWHDAEESRRALRSGVTRLGDAAAGLPWAVAWCAGAGIVATPEEELDAEVTVLESFLADLGALSPVGSVFLASSAGGVYAGSAASPPYTELSDTAALAPYGHAKLAMEELARTFAHSTGNRVVVGRLSNLYGPGQNLSKPQGLVSQLCQAQLSGQPLAVYVSLDTLRDYLYVEDAAAMVVEALDGIPSRPERVMLKVFASGRATSIAALVGEATRVFRRRPPIVMRPSAASALQARDLRMSSVVWPELDRLARTPLPVGLAATGQSIARALALPRPSLT
jgi:UDP-glucose 4-epimerase